MHSKSGIDRAFARVGNLLSLWAALLAAYSTNQLTLLQKRWADFGSRPWVAELSRSARRLMVAIGRLDLRELSRTAPMQVGVGAALGVLLLAAVWAGVANGSQPAASTPESAVALSSEMADGAASAPGAELPADAPKVGIQAGHWKTNEYPAELAKLRSSTGAAGSGWREVDVNLDIARRVVAILDKSGVRAELLPATVPVQYEADAFVSIHGDANGSTSVSGYKAARATSSRIPEKDDALVRTIESEYQAATGLKKHPGTITQNMTQYYAFNKKLDHAVGDQTPSVILELGFLTTKSDRDLLTQQPDKVAEGIAAGILDYLGESGAVAA